MIKLAPSILSADFSKLKEEVQLVETAGAHYIHMDIMDGHFVPNITFGPVVIKQLRNHSSLLFDVHLMISNPDDFIEDFYKAGADILSVHVESCIHLHRTIQKIKSLGMKACAVVNPATDTNTLEYVLDDLDMVLIMSVNPGFGGQVFIPQILQKIDKLANRLVTHHKNIDIQVDGGIGLDNVQSVINAGANVIVAGSAIYQSPDPTKAVQEFLQIFQNSKVTS